MVWAGPNSGEGCKRLGLGGHRAEVPLFSSLSLSLSLCRPLVHSGKWSGPAPRP